ncbi:hypothetical protein HanPSC8_Chr05g0205511 [Helianthus annuus]|nr:hypothetical protein HanPSC8_Chr05g0205511 [Helianthus annuus]
MFYVRHVLHHMFTNRARRKAAGLKPSNITFWVGAWEQFPLPGFTDLQLPVNPTSTQTTAQTYHPPNYTTSNHHVAPNPVPATSKSTYYHRSPPLRSESTSSATIDQHRSTPIERLPLYLLRQPTTFIGRLGLQQVLTNLLCLQLQLYTGKTLILVYYFHYVLTFYMLFRLHIFFA